MKKRKKITMKINQFFRSFFTGKNIKIISIISLILFSLACIFATYNINHVFSGQANVGESSDQSLTEQSLRIFSNEELSKYNGEDDSMPIYIGYHGKVYDVSSGRKFYNSNGNYHFLAGKDSTQELEVAGGKIIESKYPVVGLLSQTEN